MFNRKENDQLSTIATYEDKYTTVAEKRISIQGRVKEIRKKIANLLSELNKTKDVIAKNNLLQLLIINEDITIPNVPKFNSVPSMPTLSEFTELSETTIFAYSLLDVLGNTKNQTLDWANSVAENRRTRKAEKSDNVGKGKKRKKKKSPKTTTREHNITFGAKMLAQKTNQQAAKNARASTQAEELDAYVARLDAYETDVLAKLAETKIILDVLVRRVRSLQEFEAHKTKRRPINIESMTDKIQASFTLPFTADFDIVEGQSIGQTIGALDIDATDDIGVTPHLIFKLVDSLGKDENGRSALGNAFWEIKYYGMPVNEDLQSGTIISSSPLFHTKGVSAKSDRNNKPLRPVPFALAGNFARDADIARQIDVASKGAIKVGVSDISAALNAIMDLDTNAADEVKALRTEGAKIDFISFVSATAAGRSMLQLLFKNAGKIYGVRLQLILDNYFGTGRLENMFELEIALKLLSYRKHDVLKKYLNGNYTMVAAYDELLELFTEDKNKQIAQTTQPDYIEGDYDDEDIDSSMVVSESGAESLQNLGIDVDPHEIIDVDILLQMIDPIFIFGYLGKYKEYEVVRGKLGAVTADIVINQLKVAVQQGVITAKSYSKALVQLETMEEQISDDESVVLLKGIRREISENIKRFEGDRIQPDNQLVSQPKRKLEE